MKKIDDFSIFSSIEIDSEKTDSAVTVNFADTIVSLTDSIIAAANVGAAVSDGVEVGKLTETIASTTEVAPTTTSVADLSADAEAETNKVAAAIAAVTTVAVTTDSEKAAAAATVDFADTVSSLTDNIIAAASVGASQGTDTIASTASLLATTTEVAGVGTDVSTVTGKAAAMIAAITDAATTESGKADAAAAVTFADTVGSMTDSIIDAADVGGSVSDSIGAGKLVDTIASTTSVGNTATGVADLGAAAATEAGNVADAIAAVTNAATAASTGATPSNSTPSPSTNTMDVGMNLAGVSYYGTQYAFLDRFKTSSEWVAQSYNGQPIGAITLDANGYPTSMPSGAYNLYVGISLDPTDLPMTDVYVITYKGTASINVLNATILSSEPGKIVFQYTGDSHATTINVTSIDPSNPLSEIHVVRQDQVALFDAGEIFNPAFLDKASQWSELRYMDWGSTNGNTLTSWDQRTTVNSASYSNISSTNNVPIEVMVALANKTNTDMWINIPAEADDDYIRKTLTYVRDNLAAGLKVKVEYSNEVWNWAFQQTQYAQDKGTQLFGTDLNGNGQIDAGTAEVPAGANLLYYGYRSAQVASIAGNVFGSSAATRLETVISTQPGYLGAEAYVFQGVQNAGLGTVGSLFNDYAITTYFGLDSFDEATIVSWAHSGQAGIDAAFAGLTGSLNQNLLIYVYQQSVAARNGLALVAYEGGVSLTAYTVSDSEQAAVLAFYQAIDADPRMADLYTKMVADFAASGGSGIVPFSDAVPPSKWGTWGTLDSIYDDSSPRYDALLAASQAAKASQLVGSDPNQLNVITSAASYALGGLQLTLTYSGTGGFNGRGNDLANTIIGGNSFNILNGGGGNDTIFGGSRNDIIDGGTGADRMIGGAGDDLYVVDNIGDVVVEAAGGGTDEVRTSLSNYALTANVENLTFTGNGTITGTGNDLDNVITASGNAASLYGGGGNDTLNGSVGADYLDGGTGADIMRGGAGNDMYIVDNVGDQVIELPGGGIDAVRTSLTTYGLANNIENLAYTGSGNFTAFGNVSDNTIFGAIGDDTLWGDAGNDILYGRGGNDVLIGGTGADTMYGGLGDDRYDVDNVGDVVVELAGQGTDVVYSSINYTLTANVENLNLSGTANINGTGNDLNNIIFGNSGDNVLTGGAGDDTLLGGAGNDYLNGGLGNDALSGDDGNDMLYGRGGDDLLMGGAGDDVLNGGVGRDIMDGGTGADTYVFLAGDTGNTRATADMVYFSHDDGDLIDLSRMDAKTGTAAVDAFNFIGQSAFTHTAGELRIQFVGGYWDVMGDTNGDGIADFSITVSSSASLVARDFVL